MDKRLFPVENYGCSCESTPGSCELDVDNYNGVTTRCSGNRTSRPQGLASGTARRQFCPRSRVGATKPQVRALTTRSVFRRGASRARSRRTRRRARSATMAAWHGQAGGIATGRAKPDVSVNRAPPSGTPSPSPLLRGRLGLSRLRRHRLRYLGARRRLGGLGLARRWPRSARWPACSSGSCCSIDAGSVPRARQSAAPARRARRRARSPPSPHPRRAARGPLSSTPLDRRLRTPRRAGQTGPPPSSPAHQPGSSRLMEIQL